MSAMLGAPPRRPRFGMSQPRLSHLNAAGQVHMVEVGDRPGHGRRAVAEGCITMAPEVLALVLEGRAAKGDVLAVARVAAIQGAKRTWELIPLCHPIALTRPGGADRADADGSGLRLEASARTTGATGVEMEALTAVQVGLLTLYDMLKSADPAMTIGPVRLLRKEGGRRGDWERGRAAPGGAERWLSRSPAAKACPWRRPAAASWRRCSPLTGT
jgi:cyclic pyranopterin monophosphate synthase